MIRFLFHPLTRVNQGTAFLIGFGILFTVYNDCVNRQWDFPVYYLAAHTLAKLQNPYDPSVLQSISNSLDDVGYGGGLPYLYPPHIARFLFPLAQFPFFTASFLWMTWKCLALEGILFLSLKLMKTPIHPFSFFLAHLLAMTYRPISLDFNAGNIATFEAFFILAGLTAWSINWNSLAGALTIFGGSFKGSSMLILLYPLHLRDWRYLRTLIISVLSLGMILLLDWHSLLHMFAFFRSPEWIQIWDEQVQSFYNCSSVTVLLRTFADTYFAEPLIRIPALAYCLIPLFPIGIFALLLNAIQQRRKKPDFYPTEGILLSALLCGILLLPPRLAGYTLIWTFFPVMQIAHLGIKQRKIIPLLFLIIGFTLIQLNLPPNHIPPGITQLLIDKDFFGLLFLFIASVILCLTSQIDNPPSLRE